jgi:hypothetical protein
LTNSQRTGSFHERSSESIIIGRLFDWVLWFFRNP